MLTDIGGDPDDEPSVFRFLLYANERRIEGLLATCCFRYQKPRPELVRERIETYGQVLPSLRRHEPASPDAEHLRSLVKDGQSVAGKTDRPVAGSGHDIEAGTWSGTAGIEESEQPEVFLRVPAAAAGSELGVICEATDAGVHPLTACRRIIVQIGDR